MSSERGAVTGITTVAQTTCQQIVIKKSRFIATVASITAPSEAMEFVRQDEK